MVSVGIVGEGSEKVNTKNIAATWGSGTLAVYATPAMALLVEGTAMKSVMPALADDETTVGTLLEIKHTAPSPLGMAVSCKTELVEVDRSRLRFKFTVTDAKGEIGSGFHERFIVKQDKFMESARSRLE